MEQLQLLLVKCRLQTIKLYSNKYVVLFTNQIFKNAIQQKARPSICFKNRGWVFQTLRENQKLEREFEKFGKVFKKLVRVIKMYGHVFSLWHGPWCPNQLR